MRKPLNRFLVAISFILLIVGVPSVGAANSTKTQSSAIQENNNIYADRSIDVKKVQSSSAVFLAPPTNDDFDNAIAITSVPYSNTQDVLDATLAGDDPTINCPGQFSDTGIETVWYQFTPSQDGTLMVDTIGSDYNTVVAIWTGTRGNLTLEGCDNNSGGNLASQLAVTVSAGETYYIEVVEHGDIILGSSLTISVDFDAVILPPPDVGPVVYDNHTINDDMLGDSNGDGDGIVECGETIELYVGLLNQGTGAATGVNATISTNSGYITWPFNTSSSYPDLPGGGTGGNFSDFDFEVASNTPDGRVITFDLDVTAWNGGPWTDSFSIRVSCETVPPPNPPPQRRF